MKNLLTVLITFLSFPVFSQDTLQVMQYNLLNYGNFYSDCTTSTNSVSTKNIHLKTITKYVKPDILTVNEISDDVNYHQLILDNVLNTDGVNYYRKAVSFNYAQSDIVNMLYYNSKKTSALQSRCGAFCSS